MKFKVGDKVKVTYMNPKYKSSIAWGDMGKVGNITEIWEDTNYDWPIRVKINGNEFGFSEDELTLHPKTGEQLLLFEL